jgi:hypothetical protein
MNPAGNMIVYAAQFDGFSVSKLGDRVLKLRAYDKFAEEISKVTNGKIGQEYVVVMIPSSDKESLADFTEENPEQTKERFRKRMNALINEYAETTHKDPIATREEFKNELKFSGIVKESTKELQLDGYAVVISKLLGKIHDSRNRQ